MAEENKSLSLEQLAYVGAAGRFASNEEDQSYAIGAMYGFLENLSRDALMEGTKKSLLSQEKGLITAIKTYLPEYTDARNKTYLGALGDDFGKYSDKTIGDVEKIITEAQYISKDPKEYFTKEQKEKAKKTIEEYSEISREIKMIEDKMFAKLKVEAISKTQKIMNEAKAKNAQNN